MFTSKMKHFTEFQHLKELCQEFYVILKWFAGMYTK